jgi:hypothetical protein
MKKIFTIVLMTATVAVNSWAQSAQFCYKGQPLADGATVTIESEEDIWGEAACETNPAGSNANGLILRNLTSAELSGTATLTVKTETINASRLQWCMGGSCDIIKTTPHEKGFVVPADGFIQTQFDAQPTQYGELLAEISVMAGLRPLKVNVRFVHHDPSAPVTFPRCSVIEEYTGTWCGNCPRGIVGLQRLKETFGERCIPIAIHMGDSEPMEIGAYPELVPETGGVPACTIDRGGKLDPYSGSRSKGAFHFGIDVDFAAALEKPAEAGLELTAQWNDSQQWDVRFTVTTTFGINSDEAPYRLAFILVEDGMKGEGKPWAQVNYFSTESGFDDSKNYTDDDMKFWREAPYNVTGLEFNHVAVNTLGIKDGIAGSVKAPIVALEAQTYSALVTTLNVKVIQDKARLSAVALLLDTRTGKVVNAASSAILPFGTVGISDVSRTHTTANRLYDLTGRRLTNAAGKGIYIVNGKKYIK